MRLASFFLFSIALHTVVLAFPVSFLERRTEQMIPVILLEMGGNGGQGSSGKSGVGGKRIVAGAAPKGRSGAVKTEEQIVSGTAASAETTKASDQIPEVAEAFFTQGVALAGLGSGGNGGGAALRGESSGGGAGEGSGGRGGFGSRTGDGVSGSGDGPGGSGFAQASYAHNPKPQYPEAALRGGWEGTVVLRVLVDPEGKSRWVEVNRSSGFKTLDQAAMETVKSWRFHPARYGERRVESWVKVPIVFRLTE